MADVLIELVRERKVLYDSKCKEYKDQTMKIAAWEEIAAELSQPVNKCKDDWTKLRNAFACAMKRRKTKKSGQTAASFVPWKHEASMSFLLPYMECRLTKTNLITPLESPSASLDGPLESGAASAGSTCSNDSFRIRSSSAKAEPNKKPKLQDILDLMKSSHDLRLQKLSTRQDMDETDLFFQSMSKAVKALPKKEQGKIKLDLHTAISQAEMRQMEEKENILRPPINILSQNIIRSAPQDHLSIDIEAPVDFPPPTYSQSTPHAQFSPYIETSPALTTSTYMQPTTPTQVKTCFQKPLQVQPSTSNSSIKIYYENLHFE